MNDILLNISGKLDVKAVALYRAVSEVATEQNIPFLVVGASARDIVLHYGHGAKIERATVDVDFAIDVPCWSAFQQSGQFIGSIQREYLNRTLFGNATDLKEKVYE